MRTSLITLAVLSLLAGLLYLLFGGGPASELSGERVLPSRSASAGALPSASESASLEPAAPLPEGVRPASDAPQADAAEDPASPAASASLTAARAPEPPDYEVISASDPRALRARQKELQELIDARLDELFEVKQATGDFVTFAGDTRPAPIEAPPVPGAPPPVHRSQVTAQPDGTAQVLAYRVQPADHPDLLALYKEKDFIDSLCKELEAGGR